MAIAVKLLFIYYFFKQYLFAYIILILIKFNDELYNNQVMLSFKPCICTR